MAAWTPVDGPGAVSARGIECGPCRCFAGRCGRDDEAAGRSVPAAFRGLAPAGAPSLPVPVSGSRARPNALRILAPGAVARRTTPRQRAAPSYRDAAIRPVPTTGLVPFLEIRRGATGGRNRN